MMTRALPAQRYAGTHRAGNGRRPPITDGRPADSRPGDFHGLCEQFISVCESAVHPLEISSALEFDGLSDQLAKELYGVADVFALGEEMYRRVSLRPAEPEPVADPWRASKIRPAVHGVLYGLPTACFPAGVGLMTGRGALRVLVVSLLASWALSQALAYLGYALLGRADPVQAARLLLIGLAAGPPAVAVAIAITVMTVPAPVTAVIFGTGMAAYMLGATVLMVLGAEYLLPVALAPGVLGSAAYLATGRPAALEHAAWCALAATPLLALGLAAACAFRRLRPPGQRGGARAPSGTAPDKLPIAPELRRAVPSAAFGLVAAGLLAFPIAAGSASHRGAADGALLASLPLALSMGAAEWALLWFRRRSQRLLRTTREMRAFAIRARLVLLAALLRYLTTALVLTAAVIAVGITTRLVHPHWSVLPQIAAYLTLGGAMFIALLLEAFGVSAFPLIACATALGCEVAWRGLGVAGQIGASAELLVVLASYAALVLGSAMRHAY